MTLYLDEIEKLELECEIPIHQDIINRFLGDIKTKKFKGLKLEIIGDNEIVFRFKERHLFTWNSWKASFQITKGFWTAEEPLITIEVRGFPLGLHKILRIFSLTGVRLHGNTLAVNPAIVLRQLKYFESKLLDLVEFMEIKQKSSKLLLGLYINK